MSLRAVYTTSPKPREYKTLPSSIINAPVLLLAKCLSVPSLDQEVAAQTVGLLFFKHVTYLCEQARNDGKRKTSNNRMREEDGGTD
uniref:Uncharacterized protein n=1 Tax=Caenorhabditis japonica TaxID=281687 RepID=A0A8R1HLU7_CAEJA